MKIYISIVILVICGASINIYFHNKKNPEYIPDPGIKTKRYQRTQIQGFNFNGYDDDNKKIISIKGDKFTVEKKKVGFFRTSLLNEARLSNAIIDFYDTELLLEGSPGVRNDKTQMTFKNSFSEKALSSFFGKGIGSVKIEPVCLRFYQGDSLITKITALSGSVRIKQRDMLFIGNVIVESGTSKLTTDSLSFNPDEAIIKTNTAYELVTTEGSFYGNQFQSSILLKKVNKENKS